MIPRTTLVTQNSARSDRSGLALFEATSGFGVWPTRVRCIMTATVMPTNKSPIQIQICGPLAPLGLALLRATRASPSPSQRFVALKDGERTSGRYSESRWMIGK